MSAEGGAVVVTVDGSVLRSDSDVDNGALREVASARVLGHSICCGLAFGGATLVHVESDPACAHVFGPGQRHDVLYCPAPGRRMSPIIRGPTQLVWFEGVGQREDGRFDRAELWGVASAEERWIASLRMLARLDLDFIPVDVVVGTGAVAFDARDGAYHVVDVASGASDKVVPPGGTTLAGLVHVARDEVTVVIVRADRKSVIRRLSVGP